MILTKHTSPHHICLWLVVLLDLWADCRVSSANLTRSSTSFRTSFRFDDQRAILSRLYKSSVVSKLDIAYLAESRGFRVTSHSVVTQDQYVLGIYRLINPLVPQERLRGVVILQHGILCTGSFFLMNSSPQLDRPKELDFDTSGDNSTTSNSLAIALANAGYDVWIANLRGTQYSKSHLKLSNSDASYWNYNVDTLIEEDLKSYTTYIIKYTKCSSYTFIGHSLGGTVGLGTLIAHQNSPIMDKMSCSVLIAPVASTRFMDGTLIPLFRLAAVVYEDLSPFPGALDTFASFVRNICLAMPRVCSWFADLFLGVKQSTSRSDKLAIESVNQANAYTLMMHQSISVKMIKHINQVHATGRLAKFSYGNRLNEKLYGHKSPPAYELSQVSAPHVRMAIVSAPTDAISTPKEINWIRRQLANRIGLVDVIEVKENPFNHLDLIWSHDTGRLVNSRILDFMTNNRCSHPQVLR